MKRLVAIVGVAEGNKTRLIYFFDENGKVTNSETTVGKKTASITDKYPSAEFYEREIHEFYGVEFEGCPNITKRLFKAEDDKSLPFRGCKK